MAAVHRWCLWRLLLAVWILNGSSSPATFTRADDLGRLLADVPKTFTLNATGDQYKDVELELQGYKTRFVRDVDVTMQVGGKTTVKTTLPVPPVVVGDTLAPRAAWLLCGSAAASSLTVKINWNPDVNDSYKEIHAKISVKDARFIEGGLTVRSSAWKYMRLTWPQAAKGQQAAAVWLGSGDVTPAVACLTHQCVDEATLSPPPEHCRAFTSSASFNFSNASQVQRLPTYLYVRLDNDTNISDIGKPVQPEVKLGSSSEIEEWLSSLAKMKSPKRLPPTREAASRIPPAPITQHGAPTDQRGVPDAAHPRSLRPVPQGAHTDQRTVPDAAHPRSLRRTEEAANNNIGASHTDSSYRAHTMSGSGHSIYNLVINGDGASVHGVPSAAAPPSPSRQEPAAPTAYGTMPPGQRQSGVVSRRQPGQLQFAETQLQNGLLTLEMSSNGSLVAVLMLTPEPKVLTISSVNGRGRGHLQLCPSQLRGGRLTVTVSTDAGSPVSYTALLLQPNQQLSLGVSEEVDMTRNQSQIRRLNFPDNHSPIGLKVEDTPPNTCLLTSVFSKMCKAVGGRLKEAVLHKYVSSDDYLLIANTFKATRRAFLRTEWASPEKCGLPAAAAAAAAGPLRVLLNMIPHEDSDVMLVVLLPPVVLALVLPALVWWLVRRAVFAGWRRGSPFDDEGVTISELPETPRLPRHVPRLSGTEAKKLALSAPATATATATASGAGAAAAAVMVIFEAGYADLSEEKRQLAAMAAGWEPTGRAGAASPAQRHGYPDLTEEQRQEVAEAEAAEAEEQKERLAAQLGVGGRPASPSAPVSPEEGDTSVALLSGGNRRDGAGVAVCRTASDASGAVLVAPSNSTPAGPLAVTRPLSAPALWVSAVFVIPITAYFSAISLGSFFSGDAGACPVSAHYTVMSSRLPGIGGLVNLVPTVSYVACLWLLRRACTRHAAPSLVKRGVMWPAPGLDWLLLAYGVQSAVTGLCPGHSPCFATNTFVVAFVGVLTVSRVPSVLPVLPLTATVAGSALVSAADWMPVPGLRTIIAATAAAAHLLSVGFLYRRLLLPTDIGPLTSVQQLRLLVPGKVGLLAFSQVVTAVLGVTFLSPAGYLALAGWTTLLTTLVATRQRKGTVLIRTPLSSYAELSQLVGLLTFFAAITVGELAYAGRIGLLAASSVGQLLYLVSCFTLALGVSPRPLQQ